MKRLYVLKRAMAALMLAGPALASAGNIPQYVFSTGDAKYVPLTGSTVLADEDFEGYTYLLPEGHDPNPFVSDGYDLGMKFRFGGCEFDRFVVENNGQLLLGNGMVDSKTAFSVVFQPMMYGLKKARISYKTEGATGRRVFTLEYADVECASEGNASKFPGFYDLQIKLHEDTGRVEIIFHQPYDSCPTQENGFKAGLTGWSMDDDLFIRGKALREFYDSRFDRYVYPDFTTATFPMPDNQETSTYLVWNTSDIEEFTVNYNLDPVLSQAAPKGTPQNLKATQSENMLTVTADRDPSAPATVILWSNSPFTASDYPANGSTFLAGPDAKFGNATAIYYGNDDKISVPIEGVEPNSTYYIQALSVTGYPVYGTSNPAQVIFRTTQGGPQTFDAQGISATDLRLSWHSSDPVIIAATTTKMPGYESGYTGRFGEPGKNVKVGDKLPGGGEVIFVGSSDSFTFRGKPNTLYYFRAWTLRNGTVSSTWHDAAAVGTPAMPYEPDLVNYPISEPLLGWDATSGQFMPMIMDFNEIEALRATSINGSTATLTSPLIPINETSTISFDFSLETEMGGGGGLSRGFEPGYFGTGALRVLIDGVEEYTVTEYNGKMRGALESGTYETGSSSMQSEQFTVSPVGNARITFEFTTSNSSTLYLRDFKVAGKSSVGVAGVEEAPGTPKAVYNAAGLRMNVTDLSGLPAGLYIADGKKIIIR